MIVSCALALIAVMVMAMWAQAVSHAPARELPPSSTTSHAHRGRQAHGRDDGLVDLVERVSRDVRSGLAMRPALLDALRQRPGQLAVVLDRLERGEDLARSLAVDERPTTRDARFVLHGLRLAAETGGAVADTLDRVVTVVRERQVWRAERQAQASQARLSARMLTVLPMAVAAWGLVSGPRVRQAYVESPAAVLLSAVGVVLNVAGWWWMRRLVQGRGER